ncbi:MAG: DUF2513 domain-containing protein, partial [Gammaproteobacteria bacterium]
WELIRQILRKVEDKPDTQGLVHPNQFTGYAEETVSYHMWLLDQAGLIEATCQTQPPRVLKSQRASSRSCSEASDPTLRARSCSAPEQDLGAGLVKQRLTSNTQTVRI